MLDGGSATKLQRASGRASAVLRAGRLAALHQAGSAKAMLPRNHRAVPEVVFLNTAGGVTGGDRFETDLTVESGAAVATTQTAERAYRSASGMAHIDIRLRVGNGAELAWLPQETILYDGAAMRRETRVELVGDAEILLVDIFVLGRIAMGETVSKLRLMDFRKVYRDGRLVVFDPLRVTDGDLVYPGAAGLGNARAFAALHLVAPDAVDRLDRLRRALPGDASSAASAWEGRLVLRALASDPVQLRATMARAITSLTGAPLPRVWPH